MICHCFDIYLCYYDHDLMVFALLSLLFPYCDTDSYFSMICHCFDIYLCYHDHDLMVFCFVIPTLADCLIYRALIVNIGDMMERWTNCLFR